MNRSRPQDDESCPEVPLLPERPGNALFLCACGWFWGPQPRFLRIAGVSRCLVGYTGGQQADPTYRNIQDHTEALLMEFDPRRISYDDLVIEWSRMHTPMRKTKCQYRSAVWYLNEEQKEIGESIVMGMKATYGTDISSSVEPATRFYRAEEYHQNFHAKMMGEAGERF